MSKAYVKTAIAACLIMSAMIAGTVSFGFFMDPVTNSMGFERATFSLYFSLITIVGTITLPICGRLIERFGTRPFVIFGGIWTGVAMAALSLCQSLPAFYIVGCLVGLGFFWVQLRCRTRHRFGMVRREKRFRYVLDRSMRWHRRHDIESRVSRFHHPIRLV